MYDVVFNLFLFILSKNFTIVQNLYHCRNPGDWKPLISGENEIEIKNFNPKQKKKYFKNLFAETCDGFWNNYYGI